MGSFLQRDELLGQSQLNCWSAFCSWLAVYQLTLGCLSQPGSCIKTGFSRCVLPAAYPGLESMVLAVLGRGASLNVGTLA